MEFAVRVQTIAPSCHLMTAPRLLLILLDRRPQQLLQIPQFFDILESMDIGFLRGARLDNWFLGRSVGGVDFFDLLGSATVIIDLVLV